MIRTILLGSVALAALVACSTFTPSQVSVDQYVDDARRIAGEDLKFLMPVCNPQPAVRAGRVLPALATRLAHPRCACWRG